MALESTHPQYDRRLPEWKKMHDAYEGEDCVKSRGKDYLPITASMEIDGMQTGQKGLKAYEAYKMRAVFPEYVTEAVETFMGMLHYKPPTITLPAQMEPLRERATQQGETLEMLLRRINEEQLVSGRGGLLLDLPVVPDQSNPLPYIAFYIAESITNWDDGEVDEGEARLNLVVLNETAPMRIDTFQWEMVTKYRVLMLGQPDVNEPEGAQAQYAYGIFGNGAGMATDWAETLMQVPVLRGVPLQEIPFVFFNTKDIISTPDKPPLLQLANLCFTIYRGEADYRQNLFMQGQDTLVVIGSMTSRDETGASDAIRTGAGAFLEVDEGGDAKYIGVESEGLSEQRSALENDRARAANKSGQLVDTRSAQKESGDALRTRVSAQTASLQSIAKTGAAALEAILRHCAVWLGLDPETVTVEPNLEFAEPAMTGKDVVDLMTARTMGAPLSRESVHGLLVDRGFTKMDYKTELEKLNNEEGDLPPRLPGQVDDPNDPQGNPNGPQE